MLATIVDNQPIADGIFKMELMGKEPIGPVRPGQFIHLKAPSDDLLLRRPISVNDYREAENVLTIVYQLHGKGTKRLSAAKPGETLDFTGPLGNGFSLPKGAERIALLGGGVGVAPLLYTARQAEGRELSAFLGFRSSALAYQLREFKSLCREVTVATEDGTLGEKGYITEYLANLLKSREIDLVLACGPTPMLAALKKVVGQTPCQVSLEQRMGCGMGACRACSCKLEGKESYKRVCYDGPVFDIREVELG